MSELRREFPLKILPRISHLPRSTYYYHLERDKVDKYGAVRREIREIFAENRQRYGHRRVALALREKGVALNRKTVLRLMREMGLQGKVRRRKYRSYRGEAGKSAPNLLRRDFKAAGPFEKLATDVTEFAVCGAKVYLSPVMDLYNNEIVSHSVSTRAGFAQTREMLAGLFERLPRGATPILHSDRGWQYRMREFGDMLREHGVAQGMSGKGNCFDNAAMESFFGRLKVEMFHGEEFLTVGEFVRELESYIRYWNSGRLSLTLDGTCPARYQARPQAVC